jgi:hypothetical protein
MKYMVTAYYTNTTLVQKVPRKRFGNIASVKEKKIFRKNKTHSEVSRA